MAEELSGPADWYALVADDDEDWRTLMAATLRRAGFQVCEATDGDELLSRFAALQSLHFRYLVVVSDVNMPGTDGVEATELLRGASGDLPILIVTGNASPEILDAARKAGANRVLAKPLASSSLIRAVREIIGENSHT